MNHYLDLIPISARVRRRQTLVTRLCIVLSVFLIASLFGMADMFLRSQRAQTIQNDGAWHAAFQGVTEEQTARLKARSEVEGTFPVADEALLLTESTLERLDLSIGDQVELTTPETVRSFRVCGALEDTTSTLRGGAAAGVLAMDAWHTLTGQQTLTVYVAFHPRCSIPDTLEDICQRLDISREKVAENTRLLAMMLQSQDSYVVRLYLTAIFLAALVAFAGVLMILGSLNLTVARRTEFFGLLRCLGAEPGQGRRFVYLEALSWCRTAIPIGLGLSVVAVWILCALLRVTTPTWFAAIPVFGVSLPGLVTGALLGLLTVLVAALRPARQASRVSPLSAVTGGASALRAPKRAADTRLFPVEAALGIHHATGNLRNLVTLTASFAFSILLFLAFRLGTPFLQHALTALQPWTPDLSVVSTDLTCSIPPSLQETLGAHPAVKRIFGRSFVYHVPLRLQGTAVGNVTMLSYEQNQFGWAEEDLTDGSLEDALEGHGVLIARSGSLSFAPGDTLELETSLGTRQVPVAGVLSYGPFDAGDDVALVICSEELFRSLTGETGYTILDLQLSDASNAAAEELHALAGDGFTFSDRRASNQEIRAASWSFSLFVYGFLSIIALIAALNVINSVRMSVHARLGQYGAMRAAGMELAQLRTMVAAETLTFLFFGVVLGLALGIPLHQVLFRMLITERWGDAWTPPLVQMGIIGGVLALSAVLAVRGPMQDLRRQSVTETIHAL